MAKPPLTGVDRRPRVHVWNEGGRVAYSFGPCGARIPAETPGAAVDLALQAIGHGDAVIFHEAGTGHG